MARSSIQETARLRDGRDEVLGTDDPADTPAGETEALGKTVNDDDRVRVHVVNVGSTTEALAGPRLVVPVLVPRVELVQYNGGVLGA